MDVLKQNLHTHMPLLEIALRLAAATVLASLLGLEREWQRKPAGLRTYMMVGLGAAGFTIVTLELLRSVTESGAAVNADPIRIVSGVVGGIGFLGAGTILRDRGSVEGVTTAAGIWVVGAIGIACGVGAFPVAILVVVLAGLVFTGVGLFERLAFGKHTKERGENR